MYCWQTTSSTKKARNGIAVTGPGLVQVFIKGRINTHVHHPPPLRDALFDNVHKSEKSLFALSVARLLDCATLVAVERLPYVRYRVYSPCNIVL
jgi:hypothetical protein